MVDWCLIPMFTYMNFSNLSKCLQKKSDGKDGLDVAALKRTLVTIQDLTVALDKLK